MLEPHLVEIKQQGKWKLWHPKPLAHGKLLHAMLHWENRRAATLPDTGSKPAWETFSRPTGETQMSHSIPPATPTRNQHSSLGRLTTPPPTKQQQQQQKTWTINKELKTNTQQRGRNSERAPKKGGEARSWSLHELSVNKCWKGRRADRRWEISCFLK
jgi:hypothetical protein